MRYIFNKISRNIGQWKIEENFSGIVFDNMQAIRFVALMRDFAGWYCNHGLYSRSVDDITNTTLYVAIHHGAYDVDFIENWWSFVTPYFVYRSMYKILTSACIYPHEPSGCYTKRYTKYSIITNMYIYKYHIHILGQSASSCTCVHRVQYFVYHDQ